MRDLVSVRRPADGEAAQPAARSSLGVLLVVMLALAGLIGLSSPAGAAPARALVLVPSSGPASSTVTASGAGFKKRTLVETDFDASRVAIVRRRGCTAEFLPNSSMSRFTCPVPSIAAGGTTTRNVNVSNLSSQAPRYLQISANTVMPGDTNFFNNRAGTTVVFG